jgi:hypothetical protein
MIYFGSKRHGDDIARAWLTECAADPGHENAPREWIVEFRLEREEGAQRFFQELVHKGYAYYASRKTAERAARCFLETASIAKAQKIKPLDSELFRPDF